MTASVPPPGWEHLHPELKATLAREALRHAAGVLADQAETMAEHMEQGTLSRTGGAEALWLFSRVIGSLHADGFPTIGSA